jgi:hypothetical protein
MASQLGARLIIGIDGDYVRQDRLLIDPSVFRPCNLETKNCCATVAAGMHFDLVMSLEVAEHLSEGRASSFIDELCSLGDLILFSAAVPGQGGVDHINEQWPAYWNALFRKCGFHCFDILRSKIWGNTAVERWYAQNAFLFARTGTASYETLCCLSPPVSDPTPLVHPGTLSAAVNAFETEIKRLKQAQEALKQAQEALLSSRSWKVTAPLRAISELVPRRR